MREVAVGSDACQVEFTLGMNVQATLAELAVGERFAVGRRVHKLTRIAARAVWVELTPLQHLANRTASWRHRHRAQHWKNKRIIL